MPAGAFGGGRDLARFGQIERHRLFAEDMETRVERGNCHRRVEMIGRHDRQGIDPLVRRQRLFARQQRVERIIGARRIDSQRLARAPVAIRVAAEGAGHQSPITVQCRRSAVDRPDKGAFATADHAQTQRFSRHPLLLRN